MFHVCKITHRLDNVRHIFLSANACGRRSTAKVKWLKMEQHPYDSRFPISPKDIERTTKHSGKLNELLDEIYRTGHLMPQPTGQTDKSGNFFEVPEMIPEFVVPDLTDCKLKPYVSWKVQDITQEAMTPAELFKA